MSTSGQQTDSILTERDESSDILAPLPSDISRLGQGELGFTGKRHLPYRRPTEPYRGNNRVASLPETVPSSKIRADQPGSRAVSASAALSAHNVVHSSQGDYSIDSIVSSYAERSVSSGSYRSFSGSSHAYEPTPSPPSSPESSIMIINDNNNDGSKPFQQYDRRKAPAAHVVQDEDGWISMAHSPPRAIPALHGPLSLPYARCPSGAEGTIIQGEDYSRMIWGLGSGQTSNNHRTVPPAQAIKPEPAPEPKAPAQRQTYEDLDKARSPISLPGNPLYQSLPREMIGSRQTYSPYLDYGRVPDNVPLPLKASPELLGAHFIDGENDLRAYTQHSASKPIYQRSTSMSEPRNSSLKSSAPAFVPTLQSQDLAENALGHPFSHRAKGRASLPTPPSSSEPLWNASFQDQPPVPVLSAKALSLLEEIERAAISRDESEQLRNLVFRELGGMKLDDHERVPASSRRVSMDNSYRSSQGATQPIRDPLPPHTYYEREKMELPPTPPAADEAQLAGSRQPRSVPFARMMERRRMSTNDNTRSEEVSVPPNTPASTQPTRRLSQGLQPIEPIHASLYPRAQPVQSSQKPSSRASSPSGTDRKKHRRSITGQEPGKLAESGEPAEGRWNTIKRSSKSKTTKAPRSKKSSSGSAAASTSADGLKAKAAAVVSPQA